PARGRIPGRNAHDHDGQGHPAAVARALLIHFCRARPRTFFAPFMSARRADSEPRASANAFAPAGAAANRESASERRSRQMWSTIGWLAVAHESTRLNALIRKQAIRRIQQNLHPGRILCESFVVGDFPGPCGAATAQDKKRRYCTAGEAKPHNRRAALLRQTGDRLSEESCEFLPATCRRSCPTFPAARLQRQEIIQRSSNAWQFGVSNGYEMSCFGQALALSPKLLAFLWSNRAFQIRCAL